MGTRPDTSTSDEAHKGQERTYGISTMMGVLGISRSTMRYYERQGILEPGRSEGPAKRRVYSDADVFRVASCAIARNSGLALQEVPEALDEPASDPSTFLDSCLRANSDRLAWDQAVGEALCRIRALVDDCRKPVVTLRWIEAWNVYCSSYEEGYDAPGQHDYGKEQGVLIKGMPVSSFATIYGPGIDDVRWARAVPAKHATLLPELGESSPVIMGDCPCAALPVMIPTSSVRDVRFGAESRRRHHEELSNAMRGQDCEAAGERFVVGILPVGETFYGLLCQPVRAKGLRGRRALARLKPGQSSD